MIVRKSGQRHQFTIIDRSAFEDEALSPEAKGIYGYCIVKPDNWNISMQDIQKRCNISRGRLQRVFRELKENGYADRNFTNGADGKINGSEWVVYEVPSLNDRQTKNTIVGEHRQTKKPAVGKTDRRETDLYNEYKEELNTKKELNTNPPQAEIFSIVSEIKKEENKAPGRAPIDPNDEQAMFHAVSTFNGGAMFLRTKQAAQAKNLDVRECFESFRLWVCNKVEEFHTTGSGQNPLSLTPQWLSNRFSRWIADQTPKKQTTNQQQNGKTQRLTARELLAKAEQQIRDAQYEQGLKFYSDNPRG